MELLVFSLCPAFLSAFTAVDVSPQPPCGKVWVEGRYNKHHKWIEPHWNHRHSIPGHHKPHGEWIPGDCG